MTTLILIVLGSLGTVFLWGLMAPRNLWRAFVSWSYRDPYLNEPTGNAYGLLRVVSVIGITTMVVSGVLVYHDQLANAPLKVPAPTTAELLWGSPEPVVVNRVVQPVKKAPDGFVDQPILGYQDVIGKMRQPSYLFSLAHFDVPGATTDNGYIGVDPIFGLVALDSAQLVVRVAGDPQCFPHAAVVKQTGRTVSIGIYYGRAMPDPSAPPEDLAECRVLASGHNISTIIPIQLTDPLGKRDVVALDGSPLRRVAVDQ